MVTKINPKRVIVSLPDGAQYSCLPLNLTTTDPPSEEIQSAMATRLKREILSSFTVGQWVSSQANGLGKVEKVNPQKVRVTFLRDGKDL